MENKLINMGLILITLLALVFLMINQINAGRQQNIMEQVIVKTLDLRSENLKMEIEASIESGMVSIKAIEKGLSKLGELTETQMKGLLNDIIEYNSELKKELDTRMF